MAEKKSQRPQEEHPTVNVAEFIVEWTDNTTPLDRQSVEHEAFIDIVAEKMGITRDMASELDNVCKLSALDCEGEPTGMHSEPICGKTWIDIPTDVTSLITIKEDQQHRRTDKNYRNNISRCLKYKQLDAPWIHEIKNRLHKKENLPMLKDAILTVHVYDPSDYHRSRVMIDIHVLGQQPLTALRDKINCRIDNLITAEMSEHPDIPPDSTVKDQFPSGFFFIEGVFYNDMRHPNARDYSLVIRDWAAQDPSRGLGPYQSAKMEDTMLDSLSFQLGHPYVYVHQANCEHLVVFADIRMVHPEDCLKVQEYPIAVPRYKPKSQKCRVCIKNDAVWMLRESKLAPEDPCYFCDTCHRMFHYTKDGEKIGNFRAYYCKGS